MTGATGTIRAAVVAQWADPAAASGRRLKTSQRPLRRGDAGDLVLFIGTFLGELIVPAARDLPVDRPSGAGATTFVFEFQDRADGFFAAVLLRLREQFTAPPLDDSLVVFESIEQVPAPSQGLVVPVADAIPFGGVVFDQQQQLNQPDTPVQAIDPLAIANLLGLGRPSLVSWGCCCI